MTCVKNRLKHFIVCLAGCFIAVATFFGAINYSSGFAEASAEYESGYIYIYDVADYVTVRYSDDASQKISLTADTYTKISIADVLEVYFDDNLGDLIEVSYDGSNYEVMSKISNSGTITIYGNLLIVRNIGDSGSTGSTTTDDNDGDIVADATENDTTDDVIEQIKVTLIVDQEITIEYIDYGDKIVLADATKEGYEFVGWSTEDSLYKGSAIFLEDVELTAEFKIIDYSVAVVSSSGITYSVVSSGNFGDTITIEYQLEEGYYLKGVTVSDSSEQEIDLDGNEFILPASDVTINLSASLNVISYEVQYGTTGSAFDFCYGEEIQLDFEAENKVLLGWYLDEDFADQMPTIASGENGDIIKVYPYLIDQYYEVTYVMSEVLIYYDEAIYYYSADAITATAVEYGEIFTASAPETDYEGNVFAGWYFDDQFEYEAGEITITENVILYAKYELETYTITYYYDENYSSVYTEEVAYLGELTPPETTDTDYYIFEEWIGDTTQLATEDCVFFAEYQQLYDNYYYCGDTLLGIVVGELSVVPEGDIDDCECEGQTLTGFSLVYVSGTMAVYSAEHTANTYGIYYTNSTGATLTGAIFAQFEDTVYVCYTLEDNYTFYGIYSDEVELTLDDDGEYYYFAMPANDVYITITTNKVTTTTTVTDTSSLTDCIISGQYSIRNSLEETEVYIALSEGSVSEEQLNTFILSLGTNTASALSVSLDLYDTDYNAIDFPDSTNLGVTVPISSDIDINSYTFSVVKLSTFSNETYECKVFTIDEQNYVSFTVSDGGIYTILYTAVEIEDFTLTNFDVLLVTFGTLLFVVLLVIIMLFIRAKREIKRLIKLNKSL